MKRFREDLKLVVRYQTIVEKGLMYNSQAIMHEQDHDTHVQCSLGLNTNTPQILPSMTREGWARGFLKRMCPQCKINKDALVQLNETVDEYISERNLRPLPKIEISHDNLDQLWLNDSKYTRRQKQRFHAILENYLQTKDTTHLFDIGSFIKKETYSEHKESRTISAPSNLAKCLTALVIKPIENMIYNEHYIKHHKREEIIDMVNKIRKHPILYETDYTSFEGTISVPIMQAVELKIFKYLLQNNMELYNIIERIDISPTKYEFTKDTYAIMSGSRKSGCLWTSLGNGITNEMLMRLLAKVNQVDLEYLVEGDDGLIGCEATLDFTVLAKLGFVVKASPCSDINELSFCGMIFSRQDCLTCKIQDVINTFGYTFDSAYINHKVQMRRLGLLKAKALSYYYMYPHTPIVSELSYWIITSLKDVKVRREYYDWWEYETFGHLLTVEPDTYYTPTQQDILFAATHQNLNISAYSTLISKLQQPFDPQSQYMINMDVLFRHDCSSVSNYVFEKFNSNCHKLSQ